MEQSMTELINHTTDMGQTQMFSRDWYNKYFRRAARASATAASAISQSSQALDANPHDRTARPARAFLWLAADIGGGAGRCLRQFYYFSC